MENNKKKFVSFFESFVAKSKRMKLKLNTKSAVDFTNFEIFLW